MKKTLSMLLAILMLMVPLAACGDGGDATEGTTTAAEAEETTAEEPAGKHKVGILAPAVTHGWSAAVAYHAEAQAEEMSDQIEYNLYTSGNADEMTTQLDDLKTWGAEAIVVFPQWEGMEVPIQQAIEEGITVVNFDIQIDVDGIYHIAGDNKDMGVQSAKYIVDKIGTEGKVVILDVPTSGSVARLRKEGFTETMADIAPDMELVEYATQFTREDGLNDMADILTSNDHIDAVFSMDDETSIGALQAIAEAGRTDIKAITGGGGMQEYFKMMPENEDMWIASATYSPAMVKEAVIAAVDILNGEDVEAVKTIPTTIVDRDNYDDFLDENSPY